LLVVWFRGCYQIPATVTIDVEAMLDGTSTTVSKRPTEMFSGLFDFAQLGQCSIDLGCGSFVQGDHKCVAGLGIGRAGRGHFVIAEVRRDEPVVGIRL
jgi:hypothetical protein